MLAHIVYFWMKQGASSEDRARLETGLRSLLRIPSVLQGHVGQPAATERRTVVDHSYDFALLVFCKDVQAHDDYQAHPIHDRFRDEYSPLWERVVIYDSVHPDAPGAGA